ncbi:MAG: hypothetical protein WCJ01_00055 [Ignavibacteria bacterium]
MDMSIQRKVVMYQAMQEFIEKWAATIATKPPVLTAFTTFKEKAIAVENMISNYDEAVVGKTNAKKAAAKNLIDVMFPLSGALYGVGVDIAGEELKALCDKSLSVFQEMTEMNLYNSSKSIIDAAKDNLAGLVVYEYDLPKLTEIEDLLGLYKSALGKRELSQGEKKAMRKEIFEKVSTTGMFIRKSLDKSMIPFRTENEAMYKEYQAIKTIKNLGIRHEKPTDPPVPPVIS